MSGRRPDEKEECSERSETNQERPHIGRQRSQKLDFKCVDSDIIRCVCACIVSQIQKSEASGYETDWEYSAFDDTKFCSSYISLDEVQALFSVIHSESQMEFECMIVVLIYIERLAKASNHAFRICSKNWKLVVCTCMMLASKIWDDFSMINRDFAYIIGEKNGLVKLSLSKLNLLEVILLKLFDFNIEISAHEYKSYHTVVQNLIRSAATKTIPNFKLTSLVTVISSDAGDEGDTPANITSSDNSWTILADRPHDTTSSPNSPDLSIAIDRNRSQSVPAIKTSLKQASSQEDSQHPNHPKHFDPYTRNQSPERTITRRVSLQALVWRRASGLIRRVFSREDSASAKVHAISQDEPDSQSGTPISGSPLISGQMSSKLTMNGHLEVQ